MSIAIFKISRCALRLNTEKWRMFLSFVSSPSTQTNVPRKTRKGGRLYSHLETNGCQQLMLPKAEKERGIVAHSCFWQ